MIWKKILAILSLFILPIYLPIVVIFEALVTLFTCWKKDINGLLPNFNKVPEIFSNFKKVFSLNKYKVKSRFENNILDDLFEVPKKWFWYTIRAKFENNMPAKEVKKIKDNIEIVFYIPTIMGKLIEIDWNEERAHLSCRVNLIWTIVCKGILSYKQNLNKKLRSAYINISKDQNNKHINIIEEDSNKVLCSIICKKLYIKNNELKEEKK